MTPEQATKRIKLLKLKQKYIAIEMDISATELNLYLKGKRGLKIEVETKLRKILGL